LKTARLKDPIDILLIVVAVNVQCPFAGIAEVVVAKTSPGTNGGFSGGANVYDI